MCGGIVFFFSFMKLSNHIIILLLVLVGGLWGCTRPSSPKPRGYYRIHIPDHQYVNSPDAFSALPYRFALSTNATIRHNDQEHPYYINVDYPSLNATIHCTYLPIQGNLAGLLADAQEMVYSHTVKASAIPEQEYADAAHQVYGMLYELEGNTATSSQFYLTDSLHHFFRAAVYINTIPNQDSLAPVIDYLRADVREIIETFRWQK